MQTELQQSRPCIKPLLSLENIGKAFNSDSGRTVQALTDVSFSIQPGEFVTIVGATGSGKTTLLNLIAKLENSDAGRIKYNTSMDIKNYISYVFQHYTLLPWLNIQKNISFGLKLRKIDKKQRMKAACRLMRKTGLKGFERAYPHELSGGMRQRAAIAQALAIEPKLLLMDEPFGSLDDATRYDLQQMLINIHQQSKTTILFVTHNIDEAVLLADRIIVLSKSPGTILKEFKITLEKPRNRNSSEFTDLFLQIRNLL